MNPQIDDGGPAFPVPPNSTDDAHRSAYGSVGAPGMSLRDWFAGQALHGILAKSWNPNSSGNGSREWSTSFRIGPNQAASRAYEYADAMLAQRQKKAGEASTPPPA
jgi:hypothetical protein